MTAPSWESYTEAGTRYGPLNQDATLVVSKSKSSPEKWLPKNDKDSKEGETITNDLNNKNNNEENLLLFSVFDGHALLGEKASSCARKSFEDFFTREFDVSSTTNTEKSFRRMFEYAHEQILKIYDNPPYRAEYPAHGHDQSFHLTLDNKMYEAAGDIKPIEFGCTAASAILFPEELWVAWVGDSRILICYEDETTSSLRCFYATVDHNTLNEEEFNRLDSQKVEAGLGKDGYVEIESQGFIQNLAVTRALGHLEFAEKGGVICTPEMRRMKRKQIRFVVLMSDGVCGSLKPNDIMEICVRSKDAKEAAKEVVQRSIEASKALSKKSIDNTTAVVVSL